MPKGNNRNYKVSQMRHMSAVVKIEYPSDKKQDEVENVEVPDENGERLHYFIAPENYDLPRWDTGYDIPVLFERDNISIWVDGSLFVRHLYSGNGNENFDLSSLHRKASMLLEYKTFLEERDFNYRDFSQSRPTARVTYRYYRYLYNQQISGSVLNQKTGVVYEFYEWLAKQPGEKIDMAKVDETKSVFVRYKKANSSRKQINTAGKSSGKHVTKRSQTVPLAPKAPVPLGYVNDEGENLRPLDRLELKDLLDVIDSPVFSTQERVLIKLALDCGGRKGTLLTFRKSTVEAMNDSTREPDGCYKVAIGRGQLVNSKNDKSGYVYVPEKSAERLRIYIKSEEYEKRSKLYLSLFPLTSPDEAYVFLSNRGHPRLIAKKDPYYREFGHKIKGKFTQDLTLKLKSQHPKPAVPLGFTFHWTRATYARRYYEEMIPRVDEGYLTLSGLTHRLMARLNHNDSETTSLYLNLFNGKNSILDAQMQYEDLIFEGID